ncbi:hypothetical protein KBX35_12775 [Micromonospora sp. C32]|uniref:hypothetical protein n=1 Tax=unclassified Micromonospora TaxID=2617518 RepID=UPI001B3784BF|nr:MULTISPECIES: hypothetical protein [unclassified Micromonospora]MBQ1044649.1 hypothetical protein [Micromonospora sp. C72]MBQ1055659.1 hypothetical protein [Micromonospora sp. C32]
MTDGVQGLVLPRYYDYYDNPVKFVPTSDGGLAAWRLNRSTGGWRPANNIVDEILFAREQEIFVLKADRFVQRVEEERGLSLSGEGPIFALYETVRALAAPAIAERRPFTAEEAALIKGIRRRTFVMFEEQLQQAGDPAADPTIATTAS